MAKDKMFKLNDDIMVSYKYLQETIMFVRNEAKKQERQSLVMVYTNILLKMPTNKRLTNNEREVCIIAFERYIYNKRRGVERMYEKS